MEIGKVGTTSQYFYTENNKLHYNLDFLSITRTWPPEEDHYRLEKYRFSRVAFELDPDDAISRVLPDGLYDIGDHSKFVEFERLLAYPRLLTLKTTDMIVGEPPNISINANPEATEKLRDIRDNIDFNAILKRAVIDYSRFGAAIFRVFKNEVSGKSAITVWDPREWVPVFYPDGTLRIHYNVLGWRETTTKTVIQIHNTEDGSYEERIYDTDDTGAFIALKSKETKNVGFNHNLVFPAINTPTSTNPFGQNDYAIIVGLLQKAIQRLAAILRVLDEHADPCMSGPRSMLSNIKDTEGHDQLVFKTSKFYAVGKDEKEPKYITWDANLDSSFKALDVLCKQMYIMSEMGEAYIGVPEGSGNVVSGTAMRFKMITALEKARRIENEIEKPIKAMLQAVLALEGELKIKTCDIRIEWKDSLPKDPLETANLIKAESGQTSVKPLLQSMMDNFDIDEDTANMWIEDIIKDKDKFGVQTIQSKGPNPNPDGSDGRSKLPNSGADPREKASLTDPASSENKGEKGTNIK